MRHLTPRGDRDRRPRSRIRGRRSVAALLTLTVMTAAAACSSVSAHTDSGRPGSGARASGVSVRTGDARQPSAADTTLAHATTAAYRRVIDQATTAFVADVGRLQLDVAGDRTDAARLDELQAQADYDGVRTLAGANTINASTLDGEIDAVGPGQSFGGLHAVEQALWTGSTTSATAAVTGIAAQAPVVQFLLARTSLPPSGIAATAIAELDWVVDRAIPGTVERYSEHNTVDIVAGIRAAAATFATLVPLASAVAPAVTTVVQRRFDALLGQVAALGDPTRIVDSAVGRPERLTLSQSVESAASALADLAPSLAPFGTTTASS